MSKILISINPEYVQKILSGEKKYEYRTKIAKRKVERIIVYCTYPTKKVMAEVEIIDILSGTPEGLWEQTKESAGINKESFDEYFKEREIAYAYKLGKVLKYNQPKELAEFGIDFAPQSFVYIYN